MQSDKIKILLLGSDIKITNLPIKEVSLIKEGNLPAYGYNPGDSIELLAGEVSIEKGRMEHCLTWLKSDLARLGFKPRIETLTYGKQKDVFQIFRQHKYDKSDDLNGWFMVNLILPSRGRSNYAQPLQITDANREILSNNNGFLIIDDSGYPPAINSEITECNPGLWCIAMGISAAHWQKWAAHLGERFTLISRLSDMETTRMEMDSSVCWETIVAMTLRALRSSEVGLWNEQSDSFRCHIIVEMYPHALLYAGPAGSFFRFRKGFLPEKSVSRQKGATPCYDTLVTSMLAVDRLQAPDTDFCSNYFCDLSKRILFNWDILYKKGYTFDTHLKFPKLDMVSTLPDGRAGSHLNCLSDVSFIELPAFSKDFDKTLKIVASQVWNEEKKQALRFFFQHKEPSAFDYPPCHQTSYGYMHVIINVLLNLKEEVNRKRGFHNLSVFQLGHLRTTDPVEIDPLITLRNVMDSYVSREHVSRPLCIGVFGPPGSGKSFAVKEVAKVIAAKHESAEFDYFEFNLTQFDHPDEINAAIDLVRATVAKGKVPIAFWDEFDCRYGDHEFGYLRYFLPAMQDGVTYINGIPYYIGRAVFVFAGGVKSSWEGMQSLADQNNGSEKNVQSIKTLKIPDFMSRLRVVLDIDGIEIPDELLRDSASCEDIMELRRILLKRAFIIAHQMDTHWRKAARKTSGLLLRLLLGKYKFGARSVEAVIEASHASDRLVYGLPELIAPSAARIHAEWRVDLERRLDIMRKELGVRAVW